MPYLDGYEVCMRTLGVEQSCNCLAISLWALDVCSWVFENAVWGEYVLREPSGYVVLRVLKVVLHLRDEI